MTSFRFLKPCTKSQEFELLVLLGHRKGNRILVENNKAIGCIVDFEDERDLIEWALKNELMERLID